MKRVLYGFLAFALSMVLLSPPAAAELGIGGGIFYNRQLGDIKDSDDYKFDKDFVSYMLSVKYEIMELLAVEGCLDYYPGGGSVDYTLRPMATGLFQLSFLNAGVGINSTYTKFEKKTGPFGGTTSEDDWSDLSYHFKAGVALDFLDLLTVCGDCYYFVDDLKDIEDFDSDLLTFGARALLRF